MKDTNSSNNKVHFLGINGSGIVGVACLAKLNEFNVSGCDINKVSNYSCQLDELNINVETGHSITHLKNIDKLVVSAAVYFNDMYKKIPEIVEAINNNIEVIKWQKFLNDYLVKNKELICISGTHGKTTTTTFISDLLVDLNSDPTVLIGGINKKWNRNYRNGNGKYFVCESDEYAQNFLSYHPKYLIINNIEMEHPEFFKNFDDYKNNFVSFIKNLKKDGILIYNRDCESANDVVIKSEHFLKENNIKVIAFTLNTNNKEKLDFVKYVKINLIEDNSFEINDNIFKLDLIFGEHNIRNCVASILLLNELGFEMADIKSKISNLCLPQRRMDKLFDNNKIAVYDDYAHHHTQIFYNLSTLRRNINKNDKIIAILEPHLISRFKDNSEEFIKYMELSDFPIITKFYKSREINLSDLNVGDYLINTNIKYIESFDDIIKQIAIILDTYYYNKMHIVVMGAGLSYKLSRKIVDMLKQN